MIKNLSFYFLLIIILASCKNQQEKKVPNKIKSTKITLSKPDDGVKIRERDTITIEYLNKTNPYGFETKLKKGYYLDFKFFKNENDGYFRKCLTLNKRGKIIDTLNIMGYAAADKNLGYIGVDFKDYFAFVNSFGSGNPHKFRLIRKIDGEVMTSGFIVDSFEKPEFLLFVKGYDSLMVRDIKKKKEIFIQDLRKSKDINCMISELTEILKIKSVKNNSLVLEINNFDEDSKIKTYPLNF